MNRLISLALSIFLLLATGCVGRAAPLPPQEEGSIQSSVLHTQAPPGDDSVPGEENIPIEEAPAAEEPAEPVEEEPYVRVIDPAAPMVALTFDDGPHEVYTDLILDVLEEHRAVATFFEVGRNVAQYPQPLVRMDELGCEIASHSNAHRDLSKMKKRTMLAELDECIPAKETTEEQVEARELTRLLERWLDSLPQEDRVLFVRRYWYGEPAGKHVKRLWRLRQKLKAYLEQEGVPL